MNIEIDKIRQIALYLAENIPNLYFTKFLKLVYYLDFISVQEVGSPVTKDTYFALPYGPVPSFIKESVDLLDADTRSQEVSLLPDPTIDAAQYESIRSIFEGFITLEKNGGTILRPVAGAASDSVLSKYEKDLLAQLATTFRNTTVREIVDKTHQEPPYSQTPPNSVIDYRMAFQLKIKDIIPDREFAFDPEISFARFIS